MSRYSGMNDLILIGGGGHSKVVIDALRSSPTPYRVVGIVDGNKAKVGYKVLDVPIIGDETILGKMYGEGLRKAFIAIGTVGNYRLRLALYDKLVSYGFELINVVHKSSIISPYASLGCGNAVFAGAIINAGAAVGDNCIINTGSIVEHDCIIGSNVHIAPGAKLSGGIKVGENCLVGVGASIIQGVNIGKNSIIGAGSTVIKDIPDNSLAVGTPAKVIKQLD